MFSGISIAYFAAGYAVALALELTRLFLRLPLRTAAAIVIAALGLAAHTLYLYLHVERGVAAGRPFASWYHWCLMAAWVIAAVYVGLALARPRTALGLFMLPLVLLLVAVAYSLRDAGPFPAEAPQVYWGAIHGTALLLGTVAVTLGFVAGSMYLVQSYRLKHKLPSRPGLRLPSLEALQRITGQATIVSTCLFAAGVLAGVLMNVSQGAFPWTDPVVMITGGMLIWLVAASALEILYRPAREGAKVAYLTVASFLLLVLVLGTVLLGPHGHRAPPPPDAAAGGAAAEQVAAAPRTLPASAGAAKGGGRCRCG